MFSLLSAHAGQIEVGENEYYLYEEVWEDYANASLINIFMYVAIALAAILIGIGIFTKLKRPEVFSSFVKTAAGICAGFIVTVIVTMLTLSYMRIVEKGYDQYDMILGYVMVPVILIACIALLGTIASYICSLVSPKAFKISLIVTGALLGAMLIIALVLQGVYYTSGTAENNNWEFLTKEENIWLYVSAILVVAVIIALAFVFGRDKKNGFDTKSISYAAVCIAMSFALSYIKFFELPQGGSLTLASLVPLMLYSYMFGTKKGVLAGLVYGVLQALQDPWIIHPAQFLLDYPVAFSAIGLAGMFADFKALDKLPQVKFTLGAIVASLLRFVSHVLSGVFAFNSFAQENGINEWVYSLGYNSFVFADIAIAIAVGVIIFCSKTFIKQVDRVRLGTYKTTPAQKTAAEESDSSSTTAGE